MRTLQILLETDAEGDLTLAHFWIDAKLVAGTQGDDKVIQPTTKQVAFITETLGKLELPQPIAPPAQVLKSGGKKAVPPIVPTTE